MTSAPDLPPAAARPPGRWDPSRWDPSRWNPYRLAVAAVAVSVVLAPLFYFKFDVYGCWVPWARASGGRRPWDIYRLRADCNYPPVLLYLWTATQAAVRGLPVLRHHRLTLELFKLPNVLAWAAGVPLCDRGLRRPFGPAPARAAAVAYALSLPLLLDAAVWGQYDAILCLALVAVLVALAGGRPVLAGALTGMSLGLKFQAVVLLPAVGTYALRRFGPARTAAAVAAGLAVLVALSAPFALAGQGRPMRAAYTGAVGFYPQLTVNAGNAWQPVRLVNLYLRHLPAAAAESDAPRWVGPVTPKRVGLAAFAAYTGFLVAGLWHRPDGVTLVRCAGLTAFAFFMLPTEIHERYLVPAAVILALPVALPVALPGPAGRRPNLWLYVGLSAAAAAHLVVQQYHESVPLPDRTRWLNRLLYTGPLLALSAFDLALFAWATVRYAADARRGCETDPQMNAADPR